MKERKGFTLVELLVAIAIIAVLLSLLLSAIQKTREAADRLICQNNLKQIGLAAHSYESSYSKFPVAGGYVGFSGTGRGLTKHSFFTHILPFIEQQNVITGIDWDHYYNDFENRSVFWGKSISLFQCPTDPIGENLSYLYGSYGTTDYAPVCVLDTKPIVEAALGSKTGRKPSQIVDGLSNSLMLVEDVGRNDLMLRAQNPNENTYPFGGGDPTNGQDGRQPRKSWCWAEPNSSIGISKKINNCVVKKNDPSDPNCPWAKWDYGNVDEMYSFHTGGCYVCFCDGHVAFLTLDTSVDILFSLTTYNRND